MIIELIDIDGSTRYVNSKFIKAFKEPEGYDSKSKDCKSMILLEWDDIYRPFRNSTRNLVDQFAAKY